MLSASASDKRVWVSFFHKQKESKRVESPTQFDTITWSACQNVPPVPESYKGKPSNHIPWITKDKIVSNLIKNLVSLLPLNYHSLLASCYLIIMGI